jgi:hypothetical protein
MPVTASVHQRRDTPYSSAAFHAFCRSSLRFVVTPLVSAIVIAGTASSALAAECADVNGDGAVLVSDALVVLRAATGALEAVDCGDTPNPRAADLESRIAALEALLAGVTLVGDTLVIEGLNLQIVDGTGSTDSDERVECRRDRDCTAGALCSDHGRCVSGSGAGNLIIGYNEADRDDRKIGSHNLVIGPGHSYSGTGGIVAGRDNHVSGSSCSLLGGSGNLAGGVNTTISGGHLNRSHGFASAVLGGASNRAHGDRSAIAGGRHNESSAEASVVTGGMSNIAAGPASVVLGAEGFTSRSTTELIPSGRSFR